MTSPASAIVILLLSEASYPAPSDNLFYLHIEEMANIQAKAAHDLAVLTLATLGELSAVRADRITSDLPAASRPGIRGIKF